MVKGREKSDGSILPRRGRKTVPAVVRRQGKGTTASKQVGQLRLFCETADSPQGDVARADVGLPTPAVSARRAVPKSQTTKSYALPAMTMDSIASEANLYEAFSRVAANRGAPGPDRQTIDAVREHLDDLIPRLRAELLADTYLPGQIRRVWIPKAGGGQRGLGIPDVIDRVVQQATHQVLCPFYETVFHPSSHGFRPGRSCATAIKQAAAYVDDGYSIVVDIDLKDFFNRVHHERLLARLSQDISDKRVIRTIRRMLQAKIVLPDGVVVSTDEGAPQGGPLSPLLSNIVLDELDWELERRGHRFVRYADDCNIYVRGERSGNRVMASICQFIHKRLRLEVNTAKSAVARPEERHFLGFSIGFDPLGLSPEINLSSRSKKRLAERVRGLTPRNRGQSLETIIEDVNRYLRGWIGFFAICTEAALRTLRNTDAHIRRRLRAILLKQWRRRPSIVKRLIGLGIRPRKAWRTVYSPRRGLWAMSHLFAVDRALRNAYFAERGLLSLETLWEQRQPKVIAPKGLQLLFNWSC